MLENRLHIAYLTILGGGEKCSTDTGYLPVCKCRFTTLIRDMTVL